MLKGFTVEFMRLKNFFEKGIDYCPYIIYYIGTDIKKGGVY